MEPSDHARLVDAGWAYRTNGQRCWVIYRDPETGLWHAVEDALRIVEGRTQGTAGRSGQAVMEASGPMFGAC